MRSHPGTAPLETSHFKDRKGEMSTRAKRPLLPVFHEHEHVASLPESKRRKDTKGGGAMSHRRAAAPAHGSHAELLAGRRTSQMNVYYSQLKAETRPPNFRESWAKAVEMLEKGVDEVVQNPAGFVPSVKFSDIRKSTVPREVIEQIRRTGVAKIMGVVPKEAAKLMNESIMTDLKQTFGVTDDQESYTSKIYTEEDPGARPLGGVQEMFYSKAQFMARQHANMHTAKIWLNSLWTDLDPDTAERVCIPELDLTYIDRWRHRLPSYEKQTGMKEHLDNGGICRWADPAYRQVYTKIMSGDFDKFNPWAAGARSRTLGNFFRTFQGWLALTDQGPNDGTLEVVPLLLESISYILLRPFAEDVPEYNFCGVTVAGGPDMLEITSKWHAALLRAKVPIGKAEAGDTVWWHPDVIHGVEDKRNGKHPSNVIYIAAAPICPHNARYAARQRDAFLSGHNPPDFVEFGGSRQRTGERRASEADLSPLGRRQMGMSPWKDHHLVGSGTWGKRRMLKECSDILFGSSSGSKKKR